MLFRSGFIGTILLAGAMWAGRRNVKRGEQSQRSIMKTNALEMAAVIVMSIGALASLNEDKLHVFATNTSILNSAIASFSSGAISAGLCIAGILLVAKSKVAGD